MRVSTIDELGLLLPTNRYAIGASWMKIASARRIDGAWNVSGEYLPIGLDGGVGRRNSTEKGLRVRVRRIVENIVDSADFHDSSEVHDSDVVRYVSNDG